ncbi:MAG: hypothetical protein MK132_23270 [Lentisphaerales bacterium]|nr:hypothetical protein [Lentisphaerales bacterium]
MAFTIYTDDNDEVILSPVNFDTKKYWLYLLFESMDTTFTGSRADIQDKMRSSSYKTVMYYPIVAQNTDPPDVHDYGPSDYGFNYYFNKYQGDKRLNFTGYIGNTEPIAVPIQYPANPELWYTEQAMTQKHTAFSLL